MEGYREKPVVNCHTHIFTADHVPPFLAKTYVPWPFYYLLHLGFIVFFFRKYYKYIKPLSYQPLQKAWARIKAYITWGLNWARPLKIILAYYISLQVFFILYDFVTSLLPSKNTDVTGNIDMARAWLSKHNLLIPFSSPWPKALLVIFVLLYVPSGRNLIFFVFRKLWQFLAMLPGKQTTELLKRYINIGRYAFHHKQTTIFGKMRDQYPVDTVFVILPMDMEYMNAGRVRTPYRQQMEELARMKDDEVYRNIMFPFIFADPRRMAKERDYFAYNVLNNSVELEQCFIERFLIQHKFSGIKIYPALGYYPFDEQLLPLWKYVADNNIPVMSHCIRGTIFYRGKKQLGWNKHPVFKQAMGNDRYPCLVLSEGDNVNFSVNFTHPLNYLCLLNEKLLRIVVSQANSKQVRDLFGYTNDDTPLVADLKNLKICFGHFGGEDEFLNYFEKDRFAHSAQLARHPDKGIDFLETDGAASKGKPEQLWKDTDWYSIICSMMLQYQNVYADISYILHSSEETLPLLKQTLSNEILRTRVLYGTDFYVVRNHKSDKNLLADMAGGLAPDEFEMIAKINPRTYLFNNIHGKLTV